MHSRQHFRHAPRRGAPIDEAQQRHKKERFRVSGDEKERCRIRQDEECPANLKRTRNLPAAAEQEEISPKTPRSELSCDHEGGASADVECISEQRGNRWVCRKKCD